MKVNIGLMNRIVAYVRDSGNCSLGEIELELGIKIWKQYELNRAYKEYFKDVAIVHGRWKLITAKEPVIVPLQKQDTLSHTLSKNSSKE